MTVWRAVESAARGVVVPPARAGSAETNGDVPSPLDMIKSVGEGAVCWRRR